MAVLGNMLKFGQRMLVDDCLLSPNERYFCILQGDANLVVCQRGYSGPFREIGDELTHRTEGVWSSTDVSWPSAKYYARMHEDGNLSVCLDHPDGKTQTVWTAMKPPARGNQFHVAQLGDDGKLWVRFNMDCPNIAQGAIWCSEKAGKGGFFGALNGALGMFGLPKVPGT